MVDIGDLEEIFRQQLGGRQRGEKKVSRLSV